jgi:hypothetical protein
MDIPHELVEQFARGNGVIFVGAGLSQGAGLPGWADLVRELAAELHDCPPVTDYREIAQYYENDNDRHRLVQKLRDQLDTLDVHPTPVHQALAKFPVSAIFTTNYDDLLEQALREAKRPFAPVVSNVDASFWSVDQLQLVKLHGDLSQPESIVITTQDYERFATQRPTLARLLATTLQARTVLFLGYSATDPDLRLILTQIHDESGRLARNLYTVQFGAPKLIVKDLERRGLKVIDLGAQPDTASRNATLREWLQVLNRQVVVETPKYKPTALQEPQTAAEVLAGEIQVWLSAMGYHITVQSCDERCLDLDAMLQRGLEEQHVLVRCVAGEITLKDLKALEQDIVTRNIPKGWAVSDRRIPPSARAYADTHLSVHPFSLADFVSQIFGSYFDQLRQQGAEGDIPRYYVDLACYRRVLDQEGNEISQDGYDVIDTYVDDWLQAREANHLSILGEFGSGKTWFCRHYACRQLERYLADPVHERLPVLITLRDYVKEVEVGSLIRKLLDEQGVHLGGGLKAFEELNRRGKLLLIFDGFDEMAVKVDYETVVDYFWELAKVVVPGSKALLTCRTPYFRYATEAEKVMHGQELGRKMIVIQPPKFEMIYLEPFTDEQIHEVVTRRRGVEIAQAILSNPDLTGLARQPVLIEMLMEALPDIQPGTPINKSEIYRLAVDRWLERDISTGRSFMNKGDKLFFMMELAWEMLLTGNLKIHYKNLPKQINDHFGLKQPDEQDHYDYDIRSKSFLKRDVLGYYEFVHRSLGEYFVALRLYRMLEEADSGFNLMKLVDPKGHSLEEEWQSIIQFLWNLGPIGKEHITNLMCSDDDGKYFADFVLLSALGQTQDKQAIPLLLKSLVRFYETIGDEYMSGRGGNFRDMMTLAVLEALESLGYKHLEVLQDTCSYSLILEEVLPIKPAVFDHTVAKALLNSQTELACRLSQFVKALAVLADDPSEDAFLDPYFDIQPLVEAIQMLRNALICEKSNAQMHLDLGLDQLPTVQPLILPSGFEIAFEIANVSQAQGLLDTLDIVRSRVKDDGLNSIIDDISQYLAKVSSPKLADDLPHLIEQLENPDWTQRWKAAYALGDWGDSVACNALEKQLSDESDPAVQKIAQVSINKIRRRYNR